MLVVQPKRLLGALDECLQSSVQNWKLNGIECWIVYIKMKLSFVFINSVSCGIRQVILTFSVNFFVNVNECGNIRLAVSFHSKQFEFQTHVGSLLNYSSHIVLRQSIFFGDS